MHYVSTHEVDYETGEIVERIRVELDPGDKVVEAEKWDLRKAMAERAGMKQEKKKWLKQHERVLGKHIFTVFDRIDSQSTTCPKLAEGTYARLIYLATYLDYDQRLKKTRDKPMTKKDAEKVLGLSRAEFYRFWKEVTDAKCITEGENGVLRLSKELCFKGRVKAKGLGITRVYIAQLRKLYEATPPRSHRYLGAVFHMLPYVSVKYNVLCWNPLEEDIDKVEPMTLTDFCVLTGRSNGDVTRLRKEYQKIKFSMEDGITRWLCAFVRSDVGGQGEREITVINPRVVFMGDDWRYVEAHIMHFPEGQTVSNS